MITNNTIASYVAVFRVKILNLELVDMGSIHNLDGEIGHLVEPSLGASPTSHDNCHGPHSWTSLRHLDV